VSFTGYQPESEVGWDFGDGNFADDNGKLNPFMFMNSGTYTVTLTAMSLAEMLHLPGNRHHGKCSSAPACAGRGFHRNSEYCAPLTVVFNDTSISDPPIWATRRWSFGDGTFSSKKDVTHTYTAAGTYTVNLVASNLGGTSVSTPQSITVTVAAPVANFTGTPTTGRAPLTVRFTDMSTNMPTAWNWSFGDGNVTNATMQHPVHTYLTNGLYDVSLNATNAGGSGTFTRLGYINVTNVSGMTELVGVFRPSTHTFYLRSSGYPATPATVINWGASTDLPVTGDWNGDGTNEVGVFRPSTHMFLLRSSGYPATPAAVINWGASTDLPVTGDWTGDGAIEVGVFRPSTHTFSSEAVVIPRLRQLQPTGERARIFLLPEPGHNSSTFFF
jgi:PKD repeat protein